MLLTKYGNFTSTTGAKLNVKKTQKNNTLKLTKKAMKFL